MWTDEAICKLNDHVNQLIEVNSPGLTVWSGICREGIIGPYIFNKKVNGENYLKMLGEFMQPKLVGKNLYFMQDGAPAHYSNIFPHKWMGRRGPIDCPARQEAIGKPKQLQKKDEFMFTVFQNAQKQMQASKERLEKLRAEGEELISNILIAGSAKECSRKALHIKTTHSMSSKSKWEFVKRYKLCQNYLRANHKVYKCFFTTKCKNCQQKHHTLLHEYNSESSIPEPTTSQEIISTNTICNARPLETHTNVLLSTAIIRIKAKDGLFVPCRAIIHTGSGCLIKTTNGIEKINRRNPDFCSVFRSELIAIYEALKSIRNTNYQDIWILTYSRSAIQHLSHTGELKDKVSRNIIGYLQKLSKTSKIHLQWIPSHVGIEGNEADDALAKKGTKEPMPQKNKLTFKEIETVAKTKINKIWRIPPKHSWYGGVNPGGALNIRNRQHQTTLTRFRTGHLKPLKIENNNKIYPTYPKCSLAPAAPEHILACIRCTKQDL
ncbi:hypothetical protein LAZ67_18001866 [Cordylochernes scorpioides]|uniref:RNase H type-1 domain-containing protein n=1 Tax=Cordylochernes scorpioides TaxID=51811 RepID=A0ABY6LGA8_9ARAC|nr:hypothetical protein LAZ67_18001866 [Cordylochernes scorpioides]